jgi:hypothetical protein
MSTSPSTALALPPVIERKVKPKPTKAQLVEALATRKFQLLHAERQSAQMKSNELSRKLSDAIEAAARKVIESGQGFQVTCNRGYMNHSQTEVSSCYGEVRIYVGNDRAVVAAHKAYTAHVVPGLPPFNEVKQQIRAAISPPEAAPSMLQDPAVVKALDQMLAQLDKPKQQQIAA